MQSPTKQLLTAISLSVAALLAHSALAIPPVAVSEMSKKQLKTHKRDINEYSFNTKTTKDKANNLVWVESPTLSDPKTDLLRHFFRSAVKDGKVVATYLFVTHTRPNDAEFDRKKYDYTSFSLNGKAIQTQVGNPTTDGLSDYITQTSTLILNETYLKEHQESGMYLKAKNTFGQTDVPVKPALIAAFLKRLEKEKAKAK